MKTKEQIYKMIDELQELINDIKGHNMPEDIEAEKIAPLERSILYWEDQLIPNILDDLDEGID